MNKTNSMSRKSIRWQLLATASATALLASAYGASAAGNDSDRPLLWIELGGQLEQLGDAQQAFNPSFLASITQGNLLSALNVQKPPAYAIDEDGKISFQPEGSDWIVSAAIRYGRAGANRHNHQQTKNAIIPYHFSAFGKYFGPGSWYPTKHVKFADGQSSFRETHTIIDFKTGKDVGLGFLGAPDASSVVSVGLRFAQFNAKSQVALRGEPDVHYTPAAPVTNFAALASFKYDSPPHQIVFHDYGASADAARSFRGVGPSASWDASVPVAGAAGSGELDVDWGLNGALLIGRQKARGHHQTTAKTYHVSHWKPEGVGKDSGAYGRIGYFRYQTAYGSASVQPRAVTTNSKDFNRSREVTIPNLGAFIGASVKYQNAKVSFGYRADFFFNVMDGGIDTRKEENRNFYGPYASISIGLGD